MTIPPPLAADLTCYRPPGNLENEQRDTDDVVDIPTSRLDDRFDIAPMNGFHAGDFASFSNEVQDDLFDLLARSRK